MGKISVITPTVRKIGLDLVRKSLKRQTFDDFEWIVGSPFVPEVDCIWIKDTYKGGYWSLNRVYNDLIEKSQGELIVSWQDNTFAKPDCLERFWNNYQQTGGIIGAVGGKYSDDTWMVKTWQDPRERDDQGSFYECTPQDVEWNLCACPRQALYDVGGFDEGLDFVCYTPHEPNERLDLLGWRFYLDQQNKSYSLEHERLHEDWDEVWERGGYFKRKKELIDNNQWPKLEWLHI